MRLPEELRNLSTSTDIPFQSKWEFGRLSDTFVFLFGKCYESRYKGHVVRYYRGRGRYDSAGDWYSDGTLRNRLKLFHSRPLNLGLQYYFNVNQISPIELGLREHRNVFASKLPTTHSGVKCYAAEKRLAGLLLMNGKIIDTLVTLRDVAGQLWSGGFLVLDDGLIVLADEGPDERVLEVMHGLSTALTESTLLPDKRQYWNLDVGLLLGLTIFFVNSIVILILFMRGDLGRLFN